MGFVVTRQRSGGRDQECAGRGSWSPRCPKARHLGHPSSVVVLTSPGTWATSRLLAENGRDDGRKIPENDYAAKWGNDLHHLRWGQRLAYRSHGVRGYSTEIRGAEIRDALVEVRGFPGAQKRGTWGTHLQWLCSLLPAPGPPASLIARMGFVVTRQRSGGQRSEMRWSRFVVSQVPKSEAPGAPIFSGCAHFAWHLGHQPTSLSLPTPESGSPCGQAFRLLASS
jgi:hypothetical protein